MFRFCLATASTICLVLIMGCQTESTPGEASQSSEKIRTSHSKIFDQFEQDNILKIRIDADDKIYVNGEETEDWDFVAAELTKAKDENRMVWYYREAAGGQGTLTAQKLIDKVMTVQIKYPQFSQSSKADYSDYQDMYGTNHERILKGDE